MPDATVRGLGPRANVLAASRKGAVTIDVVGGGRESVSTPPLTGADVADAELAVVNAIVAQHGGRLTSGRSESQDPHFTVVLPA